MNGDARASFIISHEFEANLADEDEKCGGIYNSLLEPVGNDTSKVHVLFDYYGSPVS